jgi:hypothetical protein
MKTLFLAIVIAIAAPENHCNPATPSQNGNGAGNNNHSTQQTVTVPEGGQAWNYLALGLAAIGVSLYVRSKLNRNKS